MTTGNQLWESEPQAEDNPFGYFTWVSLMNVYGTSIYDGKLFTTGYTGRVYAYDLRNGTLLWVQEAPTGGEIFKYYTLFHGVTADGKIYIGTHEHSADTPLLKGAKTRVYNLNTGEEIWSMLGWANPYHCTGRWRPDILEQLRPPSLRSRKRSKQHHSLN